MVKWVHERKHQRRKHQTFHIYKALSMCNDTVLILSRVPYQFSKALISLQINLHNESDSAGWPYMVQCTPHVQSNKKKATCLPLLWTSQYFVLMDIHNVIIILNTFWTNLITAKMSYWHNKWQRIPVTQSFDTSHLILKSLILVSLIKHVSKTEAKMYCTHCLTSMTSKAPKHPSRWWHLTLHSPLKTVLLSSQQYVRTWYSHAIVSMDILLCRVDKATLCHTCWSGYCDWNDVVIAVYQL